MDEGRFYKNMTNTDAEAITKPSGAPQERAGMARAGRPRARARRRRREGGGFGGLRAMWLARGSRDLDTV